MLSNVFRKRVFTIMFVNVQGLLSHLAELVARIWLCSEAPSLLCLDETFLDKSGENGNLEGYQVIARRDRQWQKIRGCCSPRP